ncbi:hypothetical protein [Bifidobacterium jacchi]|uniref:Uncharacterized protein n=1 Tax=Bifidobacterium jacchi TaxID=2490545 RepID=A0A5N5RMI1_9BIFI|nr:hypothetical protein [Bifidobacterium jacchi]KAB5608514.1 hypothetical protein EHS19_00710 [Bifidobacterium jacchi]
MNTADTLRTLAVVFLAAAIILAVVAVILFFTLHIRDVRATLTGRTAEREIAQMRQSHGGWRGPQPGAGHGAAPRGRVDHAESITGQSGSNLVVREVTGSGSFGTTGNGATGSGATGSVASTEAGSTKQSGIKSGVVKPRKRVAAAAPAIPADVDEGGTSLMSADADKPFDQDSDEGSTSLMSGKARHANARNDADDDENAPTTLVKKVRK